MSAATTGWRTRAGLALLVAMLAHACVALGWILQQEFAPGEFQLPAGPGSGLEIGLALAPPGGLADPAGTLPLPAPHEEAEERIGREGIAIVVAPAERVPHPAKPAPVTDLGGGSSSNYFTRVRMYLSRFRDSGSPAPAGNGVTDLRFEVAADGSVRGLEVFRSGGAAERDAAALALVRRAAPLPPPPGGRALRLVVPIEFR